MPFHFTSIIKDSPPVKDHRQLLKKDQQREAARRALHSIFPSVSTFLDGDGTAVAVGAGKVGVIVAVRVGWIVGIDVGVEQLTKMNMMKR